MTYQVSVVIPVFNDYQRLNLCLQALLEQEGNIATEIIIIDNGSSKIDKGIIEKYIKFPHVHFITETKPGSYAARNAGLAKTTANIVAFTDSDCIPEPDWIKQAVLLLAEKKTDLIAGNIKVFTQTDSAPSLLETYESVLAFPQQENARLGRSVTANLVLKKRVITKIGKFKDNTFSGADHEYTSRAVGNGFKLVFGAKCTVSHPARRKLTQMRQKIRRTVGGFYKLRNSNPEMAHKLHWKAMLLDAAPPFYAWKNARERQDELELTLNQLLKIMVVASHNKWYRLWLKLKLKLGLTGFIER